MKKIIKRIFGNYVELAKLKGVERAAKVGAITTLGLLRVFLLAIACIFLSVALASYLGQVIGQPALGYALVGVLYLILFFAIRLWYRVLKEKLIDFFIKAFFDE